jgi:uncharacterized protein with von Willebrand factor type A (vWA) domain
MAFGELAGSVESAVEGFGWDLSSAWEQQREVTARDGGLVERVARLAGRMYVALRGAASKRVPVASGEVYSVEQGSAVERLLPTEYGQMMDPTLESAVLYRVATRTALQYAVRGTSPTSKGPLVLLLDESGSMHGSRNEWAKAAAVAVARVAVQERRRVAVVHYSTSRVARDLDPSKPADVLAMIRHWLSGGTDIGTALQAGVDKSLDLARKGDKGADLILVTDGIDGDTHAQVSALGRAAKHGIRLWTVGIETSIPDDHPLRASAASYSELGAADMTDARSVLSMASAL